MKKLKKTGFTISFEDGETHTRYLTPQILLDFDLSIKVLQDKKTLVPLGIPAYDGTPENTTIDFEMEITGNGIDDFQIEFLHDNNVIQTYFSGSQTLDKVVITAKDSGNNANTKNLKHSQMNSQIIPSSYPKGKYIIKWDGFDSNGIYDSTRFTSGKLKARVKGKR